MDTYPVSTTVIHAVAEQAGVDPLDLTPPLYDQIDPDALDAIVTGRSFQRIEFDYLDYSITVEGRENPTVTVKERTAPQP